MTLTTRKPPRARAFKLSGTPRPAFASMTAGNFTANDLKLAPMPAIGELAGAKAVETKKKMGFKEVMSMASKRAFRGGAAGFAAGVIQVRVAGRAPGARADGENFLVVISPAYFLLFF
jgi:hypothetical protein